jgi:hypothetical protein
MNSRNYATKSGTNITAPADFRFVEVQAGPGGAFSIQSRVPETKTIDATSTRKCCGCHNPGKWRYATKCYICSECSTKPPYQLISRTRAKNDFKLSFDELHNAFKNHQLQMFTVPNTYDRQGPPIRLYYVHEIQKLAAQLRRIP